MKIVKLRVFWGGFCCGVWFLLGIYFVEGVGPVTLSINLWCKLDYACHNMLFQTERSCAIEIPSLLLPILKDTRVQISGMEP